MSKENNETNGFKIVVREEDKQPIKSTIPTEFTNLQKLAEDVNDFFSVYKDYRGCNLQPVIVNNAVYINTSLIFQEGISNEGITEAFEQIDNPEKRNPNESIVDKLRRQQNQGKGKKYKLTAAGKEGLKDYIMPSIIKRTNSRDNDNWIQACVQEHQDNAGSIYGGPRPVIIVVDNISLEKILKEKCGDKDENGKPNYYTIQPIRPISSEANPNWLVQITVTSDSTVRELCESMNLMVTSSSCMFERS